LFWRCLFAKIRPTKVYTMNSLKNLHEVSAIYFFILAFAYIVCALMFRNGLYADWSLILMRIMDMPFALVALLYGSTTLYLQLESGEKEDEETSPWIMVIFAVCLLLFGLVVFVNFAFPSKL